MSQTPTELADLLTKMAEATKAFADAEKVRAEADKVRADTDKVRSEVEADKKLAQNELDVAAEDLETKRITNAAARAQADAARIDKVVEQISGAVPDLSSLGKGTVTFGERRALRQGEAIALALDKVAGDISSRVAEAVAKDPKILVVSDPRIVATLAAYRLLTYEASALQQQLSGAKNNAESALTPGQADFGMGVAEAGVVVAGVAGKALTELASLFELEVDVATSTADIPAYTVQAAVIAKLRVANPPVEVRHEWARVPPDDSPLLALIKSLTSLDVEVTATDARLEGQIKALGDPATRLASAEKIARDDKNSDEERAQAGRDAQRATIDNLRLQRLQKARNDLTAMVQKTRAFAERITSASDTTGPSRLARALAVEPLASGNAGIAVLALGDAKSETYQVLVKRRVLSPRIQTSTAAQVDYVLVKGEFVLTSGHATASASYAGKIAKGGADWTKAKDLPS